MSLPRDAYSELLEQTRGLEAKEREARDTWYAALTLERKEDVLFELEVLLKGLACFANPRNHPGPARRAPIVVTDFSGPLSVANDGMRRVVQLVRQLLGEKDKAFVFHRYLESVLPEDLARTRLLSSGLLTTTPDDALVALRHGMTNTIEIADGALRLPRVPFRLFYAVLVTAQREVGHSPYFNPLRSLEFRPEFDRIVHRPVLELIGDAPGAAHRLVALTFLALFRMLRYVRLLESISQAPNQEASRVLGRAYLVLATLRSDARALARHLRDQSGPTLAEGFSNELFQVGSGSVAREEARLLSLGNHLFALRAALETIGSMLRLELRRTFEHDVSPPDASLSRDDARHLCLVVARNLRPSLQNAVLFLAKSLGQRLEGEGVFHEADAARLLSDRLRRDVWMFAHVLRAFCDKGHAVQQRDDGWQSASFQFVREFLRYFRAMGYPLLRGSDYPRFDAFLEAMAGIEQMDLLDDARLAFALDEAIAFKDFLESLFHQISARAELRDVPFDRKAAAMALKLYLGG